MNNHGVVGTIREAEFGVLLEFLDVRFKQILFLLTASVPDTTVVNKEALVHASEDALDFIFADVAVDAAGGDAGIADGLGLLGDALGVVDASAVAEDVEDPLKLHFGDAIRELTDKDAGALGAGDVGLVEGVVELDSFRWIGDERNVSDERAMEGVVAIMEVLGSIGSNQHCVEPALEFDFSGALGEGGGGVSERGGVVGVDRAAFLGVVVLLLGRLVVERVRIMSVRTARRRGGVLRRRGDRTSRGSSRGVEFVLVLVVGRRGILGVGKMFAHFCCCKGEGIKKKKKEINGEKLKRRLF